MLPHLALLVLLQLDLGLLRQSLLLVLQGLSVFLTHLIETFVHLLLKGVLFIIQLGAEHLVPLPLDFVVDVT